jgi:hypothetical protein
MNEVVLAHPVWTAIGTYGGSLKSVPAVDVHGHIRASAALARAQLSLRDDWGGSTPLSRLIMRLSRERAVGLHIHRLGPGCQKMKPLFFQHNSHRVSECFGNPAEAVDIGHAGKSRRSID